MPVRMLIASLAMLGVYGAYRLAAGYGVPTEPLPLETKATDLPAALGEWKGEDVSSASDEFNDDGSEMAVDRSYQDRRGHAVSLRLSVFLKAARLQGVPHPPEFCYPANGWALGEPKGLSLNKANTAGSSARLLPVQRQGEKSFVLYWYQIDGTTYFSGDDQRRLFLACRGRPFRPPIVKVMLQMSAANPEDAEEALTSLAGNVYSWTRSFH